jgi:hypothetical protein
MVLLLLLPHLTIGRVNGTTTATTTLDYWEGQWYYYCYYHT